MELLETFFDRHLPVSVGVSPNTIKSYKYAFRLLLEYMYNKHGILMQQPFSGTAF